MTHVHNKMLDSVQMEIYMQAHVRGARVEIKWNHGEPAEPGEPGEQGEQGEPGSIINHSVPLLHSPLPRQRSDARKQKHEWMFAGVSGAPPTHQNHCKQVINR